MAQTPFTFIVLISLVCLSSCKNSDPYAQDDKLFGNYLKSTFHKDMANDSTNYILMSDNGCHACIYGTIKALAADKKSVFIISSDNYNKSKDFYPVDKNRVLVDSTFLINRLKYHRGNIGVIQSSQQTIYNIMSFDLTNMDKVLALVR